MAAANRRALSNLKNRELENAAPRELDPNIARARKRAGDAQAELAKGGSAPGASLVAKPRAAAKPRSKAKGRKRAR